MLPLRAYEEKEGSWGDGARLAPSQAVPIA